MTDGPRHISEFLAAIERDLERRRRAQRRDLVWLAWRLDAAAGRLGVGQRLTGRLTGWATRRAMGSDR